MDNKEEKNYRLKMSEFGEQFLENKNSINSDNSSQDQTKQGKKEKKHRTIFHCEEEILYGITFPGRVIMTFYSFHGLFFMLNFLIQYIILVPGLLYEIESTFLQGFLSFLYIILALFYSNLFIIPTYELLSFPFLRYRNVLAHLESLAIMKNIIEDDDDTQKELDLKSSRDWVDILLIVIESTYLIGFISSFSSTTRIITDIVHVIIIILVYFYFQVLFFGYIVISFYLMIKLYKHIGKGFFFKFFFDIEFELNTFFNEKKKPLPKKNLFCYVINPVLSKSYEKPEGRNEPIIIEFSSIERTWNIAKKIVRFILFVGSFILTIIVMIKKDIFSVLFFIIFYFSILILTLMMNFPVLIRNKVSFGNFFSHNIKYNKAHKLENPRLVSFLRVINFLILLLASFVLVISFFTFEETNSVDEIRSLSFNPSTSESTEKDLLLPNICSSSINNIPIYLYMPFINDAYYYNNNPSISPDFHSSFQIRGYRKLFFDSNVEIKVIGNLINSSNNNEDRVKMIQYDVKKGDKEITILSIKGTSNKKDLFLDMQLYVPSVFLNFLKSFSLFGQQKDTYYSGLLEYGLSIPYRLFCQYLVIDGYLQDLLKAYNANRDTFKKNVVIVGHSLGGGLSKLLGRMKKTQAISLSGPGVNAFHSLWGYDGNSENFEISAIDLVPDMDLVPRVEVSGGTVYRIICKEGFLACHGKSLSLCEVLIMCRSPNYFEYCTKMAGLTERKINDIKQSSELNSN